MNIAFVCTNYNNSPLTVEAVRSLSASDEGQYYVVVVDNNSDARNVDILKKLSAQFSNVDVIFNRDNVGYFRGLNLGIDHLRRVHPEISIIVIGNNDLVFPPEFGECLRSNIPLFEKYPVVSPDIVTLDGIHQNPHVISRIGKFREFMYDIYYANYYLAFVIRQIAQVSRPLTDRPDETQYDVAQEIYQGYGACYVLGPLFFKLFERLSAPTFMLHEEYFLSKQLNDKGFRVYYEPSIRVIHRCRGATGNVGSRRAWEIGCNAHKVYRQYVKTFD